MHWPEILGISVSIVVILTLLVLECYGYERGYAKLLRCIDSIFCRAPWYLCEGVVRLLSLCVEGVVGGMRRGRRRGRGRRERRMRATTTTTTTTTAAAVGQEGEREGGGVEMETQLRLPLPLDRPPTYHSDDDNNGLFPPPRYDGEESVDTLPRYRDSADDGDEEEEEEEEEEENDDDEPNWTRIQGRRQRDSSDDEVALMVMEVTGDLADGRTPVRWA
ncbi:hypothetical protein IWX91DRAFT_325297 [Phyllosticta citricarpa]